MATPAFSLYSSLSASPDLPSPDQYDDFMASPLANTMTPATTLGQYPSSSDAVATDAWRRYEVIKRTDSDRNALLEEMIQRYMWMSQECSKLHDQLQQEKHRGGNTTIGNNYLYKEDYQKLKDRVDRDPFVLVLIDGDGMIFHEHYLARGEEGGRQAAAMLWKSTEIYAREQMPNLPQDFKVMARMYGNVKGLADACHGAGLVKSPSLIEDFVRGFTQGDPLFDFVDVGAGKDRADEKVSEMFKLHAYDIRCKHIVFGCSHHNGFARLLEKYIFDETITKRVTLLEGLPFGTELLKLPFARSKFGTIFRSEKIVVTPIGPQAGRTTNVPASSIETEAAAALLRSMSHTPSDSISSFDDSNRYSKPISITMNWAERAAGAVSLPPPTPPTENASPALQTARLTKDTIPRNRKGQRIDPPVKHEKSEVERVRKMKMCNVHFLRSECPYGSKCTHKHNVEPSKKDLEILKVVARYACCRAGGACDDPRCIYGHRCQAPDRLDPNRFPSERGKTCIFGPDCVFPPELHNIDTQIVRVTKV